MGTNCPQDFRVNPSLGGLGDSAWHGGDCGLALLRAVCLGVCSRFVWAAWARNERASIPRTRTEVPNAKPTSCTPTEIGTSNDAQHLRKKWQ